MTITAWEAGTPVPVHIGTPCPRTALIAAARNRYTLDPEHIAAVLNRHAPGLIAEQRLRHRLACWLLRRPQPVTTGDWLDHLADLADRWARLDTVGSTDDAHAVLEEMGEGPWSDDVLDEARTRGDELSAEIDDMVREAQ